MSHVGKDSIAVIGMAGRFAGAKNIEELWEQLLGQKSCIHFYSNDELRRGGESPLKIAKSNYVPAHGSLDNADCFDPAFFGFSPRDAELMDPQLRVFLQEAYRAIADSGYTPNDIAKHCGVFTGGSNSSYFVNTLLDSRNPVEGVDRYLAWMYNSQDSLATMLSYKLNLQGPSLHIGTACSSSLSAVHVAITSLLQCECDVAISGSAKITAPRQQGYLHYEGGIYSQDGVCRPYDASASGTVGGDGVAIIVLKRLSDAVKDGDNIRAIIKASAINNDGANKMAYSAPSLDGQASVIRLALEKAGLTADSIGYIEGHGTATLLGDEIEVETLSDLYPEREEGKAPFLGSVKGHIGHLDSASGIAGLVKTVLTLQHKTIPPTANFSQSCDTLSFENRKLRVNSSVQEWVDSGAPRYAAVSSFGIGGSNVHLILQESDQQVGDVEAATCPVLLPISAKSAVSLRAMCHELEKQLDGLQHNLTDIAFTLSVGREAFAHRMILAGSCVEELKEQLNQIPDEPLKSGPLIFYFPGQGSQYESLSKALYESWPLYRENVECWLTLLSPSLSSAVRNRIANTISDEEPLTNQVAQLWVFVVMASLADTLKQLSVVPDLVVGHSLGEYVAAYVAGVFERQTIIDIIAKRGELMDSTKPGMTITVSQPDLTGTQWPNCAISAHNTRTLKTVSGPLAEMESYTTSLKVGRKPFKVIQPRFGFHSSLMESIRQPLVDFIAKQSTFAPRYQGLSNVTGDFATQEQWQNPNYWGDHLVKPVLCHQALEKVKARYSCATFVEVGPGQALRQLLGRREPSQAVLSLMPSTSSSFCAEWSVLNMALGQLWMSGVDINWFAFYTGREGKRVPTVTYEFEKRHYWYGADLQVSTVADLSCSTELASCRSCQEEEITPALAEIWQALLGVEMLAGNDNFYSLGGHSLIAAKMLASINTRFDVSLDLATILANPDFDVLRDVIIHALDQQSLLSTVEVRKLDGGMLI